MKGTLRGKERRGQGKERGEKGRIGRRKVGLSGPTQILEYVFEV